MIEDWGDVRENWRRREVAWWRKLAPPRPVYSNPRDAEIASQFELGKYNLYIGGAGNQVPGYVNIDLVPLPGVDVVCSAEALPFKEGVFKFVECMAVLEHVERPRAVIQEIFRCLMTEGVAHLVVPFCHPYHEYPKDFRRYTPDGLARECAGFEILASGWLSGPSATWIVFTLEYAKSWFSSRWTRGAVHFVLGWLLFPLRYLDAWLLEKPNARRIGNHHFLFVRKSSENRQGAKGLKKKYTGGTPVSRR